MTRPLVTLHLPLEMGCVAEVLKAIAKAYPDAVMGENGVVLSGRTDPGVDVEVTVGPATPTKVPTSRDSRGGRG